MNFVNRAIARLPEPAFRAVTRARFGVRDTVKRVTSGVEQWLRAPLYKQPRARAQRVTRTDLRVSSEAPDHEALYAAYRQADRGRPMQQMRIWRDLLERDGHLRGMINNRMAAISGKNWQVLPGGDSAKDEAVAAVVNDALNDVAELRSVLAFLLAHPYLGYSAAEIDWKRIDGVWTWAQLAPVPVEEFHIATPYDRPSGTSVGELLYFDGAQSHRLIPGKWLVATQWGFDPLARAGLMRTCGHYSLFKLQVIANWAAWCERHGVPFVIAKCENEHPSEQLKQTLVDIVRNFGGEGGAAVFGEIDVQAVSDTSRGNNDGHASFLNVCNAENAKIINGATLTNDNQAAGAASYALGNIHRDVRIELLLADTLREQDMVERMLFGPFVRFNGLDGRVPKFRKKLLPPLDPKELIGLAEAANRLGVPCSIEQIREMTDLRGPKDQKDSTIVATAA